MVSVMSVSQHMYTHADNDPAQLVRHRKFAHQCLAQTYNYDMYGFTHLEIKRMMYLLNKDNRNYPDLAEQLQLLRQH